MEVLEVEDDSDMWVPHVSGSSQVKGAVGRGMMGIFARRRLRGSVRGVRWRAT
jgi:hypothetical protein